MSKAEPAHAASVLSGPVPSHDAERSLWRDPRHVQVHRPAPKRDVPYVPTAELVVEAILDFAGVGPGDTLYDLGCGDGRIPIGAAKRGARAAGVDIDRLRIRECHWNASRAGEGVAGRLRFVRGSLFDVDLRDASLVTLYLLPSINRRLRPKLMWELKPGSRVLSNYFDMGDWKPDAVLEIHQRVLYRWTIPAWVEGEWDCVVNTPGRRKSMVLRLRRKYQVLSGTARLGWQEVPLIAPTLDGSTLSFTLPNFHGGGVTRFIGELRGPYLRGTCPGRTSERSVPWGGVRR
jgi:SAM-dependent methyltransferase